MNGINKFQFSIYHYVFFQIQTFPYKTILPLFFMSKLTSFQFQGIFNPLSNFHDYLKYTSLKIIFLNKVQTSSTHCIFMSLVFYSLCSPTTLFLYPHDWISNGKEMPNFVFMFFASCQCHLTNFYLSLISRISYKSWWDFSSVFLFCVLHKSTLQGR